MKYLIAEDEKELQRSIVNYLKQDGSICETASNYKEAISKVELYEYDIIVLDINLISGSGIEVLKKLKKKNTTTGVIIISANSSLEDKLEGLDLGADDYLTKPFHLAELNSRIKAIIRRGIYHGNETIEFNEITLKPTERTAFINDLPITLTRKEFDLLLFLITNKGRVLSKEILAEHLWGDDSDLLDNFDFIYVHMNNLRKKLTR